MGLVPADAEPEFEPLTGGVSSLIARVDWGGRRFCVKQSLEKLRVAADWRVSTARNASEVAWIREAALAAPEATPEILGHDPVRDVFAMNWFDPAIYPVWKSELMAGRVSPDFAASVGAVLGRIHAATADRPEIAARFANDSHFHDIRLAPYLEATAMRRPDLAGILRGLIERTANTRRTLVHGDVSPKNILVGPRGPVLLDAECAVYGDPAFDLAFCLNYLALKGVARPQSRAQLRASFRALAAAYLEKVAWEEPAALEARAASLLPALALARVDGKSPVEYLDEDARVKIRSAARRLLAVSNKSLDLFDHKWAELL